MAREALAATATWVREDLDLTLRVGMVPVADDPRAGRSTCASRATRRRQNISIAMFCRRRHRLGRRRDEARRDRRAAGAARRAARPDRAVVPLRGNPGVARRGAVAGRRARARRRARTAFRAAIEDIARIVEQTPDASRPVPGQRLRLTWPPQGFELEARALARAPARRCGCAGSRCWCGRCSRSSSCASASRSAASCRRNTPASWSTIPISASSTIRCAWCSTARRSSPTRSSEHLKDCAAEGIVRYGTHRQDAAMMTCFTPSPTNSNHVHFIDGALGGYAMAASALKSS